MAKKIYFIVEQTRSDSKEMGYQSKSVFTPKYRFEDEPADSEGHDLQGNGGFPFGSLEQAAQAITNDVKKDQVVITTVAVYDYTPPVFTKR